MNNSSRGGILNGIIWLVFASAITILFVRLGFDIAGKTPVGEFTQLLYSWSGTLLGPVIWIQQATGMPTTLWGLNLLALAGIVFYVFVGWFVMAVFGLFRSRG